MDDLSTLADTVRKLNQISHPDPLRISKEIINYTDGNRNKIEKIVNLLKKDMPWEYIRGYTYFYGLKFKVSPTVLIPRLETEYLIKAILRNSKKFEGNFIDVGTGSGNIICTLAKELNQKKQNFFATDISSNALKIAKANAKFHKLENKITFIKTSLLSKYQSNCPTIIISNLPYIPEIRFNKLQKSVKNYEPKNALIGGEKGYEIIIDMCRYISKKNINVKKIYLEIDHSYADSLKNIIKDIFVLTKPKVILKKDFNNYYRYLLISFS